ncbi:MAG: flagellar filament capping protein FliD [Candidatus Latescibacterota bacterium]|nr:flagellar filament capping protein FliD [Candidatus Latescibacterota bacterium]
MSTGVSFAGLSSGIDSGQIIEQLLAIDRRPAVLLENQNAIEEFKLEVLQQINTDLLSVKTSADALSDGSAFDVFSTSSSNTDLVTATASGATSPGSFSVEVISLAQAQSRSSKSFSSPSEDLGLTGEIVISGHTISIDSSDSLVDIQGAINAADVGVSAQILQVSETDNRMILTSTSTGSEGFSLLDASTTDVLQSLGFTGSGTSIKNSVTGGGKTDQFNSGTTAVGTLVGLTGGLSGNITIGDKVVAVDLATMSLTDIKAAIDLAAPTGVTTSIVAEEDEYGSNLFRLQIDGSTTFLDDNNVLEAVGLLEGISGVTAAIAEVQTASVANTTNGSDPIGASTKFDEIFGASASNGDTVSISGLDRDGNSVSGSFTINNVNADDIQDMLDEIEKVFAGVTASVNSTGMIEVTEDSTGDSQLTVNLAANNEGGGSMTFGTFTSSRQGQDAQTTEVVVGQDATFRVNGVSLTRSTNTITDALEGVTLNLVKIEAGTHVTINVAQDTTAIRASIQGLVDNFNTASSLISDQFVFNEEFQTSGPLSGDTTLLTLQSQLRSLVIDPVTGLPSDENALSLFGIAFNREGLLEIDSTTLDAALANDLTKIKNVMSASGSSSDSDIEFVFQTDDTVVGTYDVDITAAPQQGDVTGTTDITAGIANDSTITITDSISGKSDTIDVLTGDTTADVVGKINTVLASNVAEERTGSIANTSDGATAITAATTFDSIFSAGVVANDTIDIQADTHSGERVTGTFTITDPTSQTVDDLLAEIRSVFGGSVSTSVDSNGQIQITDSEVGNSSLTLVLIERNEGGGTLDFGQFDTTEEGRFAMAITATNEDGAVRLTSDAYGSDAGFTIGQTSDELGITDTEFLGVDVAGTINGEPSTGDGRVLTGDSGNSNTDGLAIRVTLTPAQLTAQGQDQGTVQIIQGVANQLSRSLASMTDPLDGLIATREGAIEDTIEANVAQIARLEERLELKQSTLQRQFTVMETTLAELNSMGSFLGSQLASLSTQTG